METVYINPEKCVGCRHCEVACALEHSGHRDIFSYSLGTKDSLPRIRVCTGVDYMPFPNRCRHCDPAPCLQVCPSGAIYRDRETSAVLVQADRCISCWMCIMICPFSSMEFGDLETPTGKQSAYKCDACLERLKQKQEPACVRACKTGALEFKDAGELIAEHKKARSLDFTLAVQGMQRGSMPENINLFRQIQSSLAELGPAPSSADY